MMRALVVFLGILLASQSWAEEDTSGLKLVVGGSYAVGSMKNSDDTLASRTINAISVRAMPGWSFGDYMLGAMLQGRWVGQLTGVDSVSGTNVTGLGYYLGVGGLVNLSDFVIQGSFDFLGNESYSNQTASGLSETISEPIGFTLLMGYKFWPQTSVDLYFGYHNFSHSNVGGTDNDISSDKVNETQFGVGITYQL